MEIAGKEILEIIPTPRPHWVGDGFYVHSIFNLLAFTKHVSSFLLFDYAAPRKFERTRQRRGAGGHPHPGFETVTIAYQGGVEHGDSIGNHGVIKPGDVQWMTAGRGILHEEYHSCGFGLRGGVLAMCQLWVNLPKKVKMSPPRCQSILRADIPQVALTADDPDKTSGYVRVIAGSHLGVQGPAKTFTPIDVWDICLENGVVADLNLPSGHNTLMFVRKGSVKIGTRSLMRLEFTGSHVHLEASIVGAQLLLLGGALIDEPIVARGPFVLNNRADLDKAQADYLNGKPDRCKQ